MKEEEKEIILMELNRELTEIIDDCAFSLVHNKLAIIDLRAFYKEVHKKVKVYIKSQLEAYWDIDKVDIVEGKKHMLTINLKEVK